MAITAAITLADSTVDSEQQAQATLTVSNSGGSAVLVTGIQPKVTPLAASVGIGICAFGGSATQSVAAGGSTAFYFNLVAHAPQASNPQVSPATFAYVVGATVYCNDGSITEASTATLTVSP